MLCVHIARDTPSPKELSVLEALHQALEGTTEIHTLSLSLMNTLILQYLWYHTGLTDVPPPAVQSHLWNPCCLAGSVQCCDGPAHVAAGQIGPPLRQGPVLLQDNRKDTGCLEKIRKRHKLNVKSLLCHHTSQLLQGWEKCALKLPYPQGTETGRLCH